MFKVQAEKFTKMRKNTSKCAKIHKNTQKSVKNQIKNVSLARLEETKVSEFEFCSLVEILDLSENNFVP